MITTPTAAAAAVTSALPLVDQPHAGDLVRLALDHLHAGAETSNPDQLDTATAYALVAIADSLTRLADRHAPDWSTLRPARDDR